MSETNEHGQQVGDRVEGWTPRPWPAPTTLTGRYVALEPLALAHAPALYDGLCGPQDASVWTYRATAMPPELSVMRDLVASLLAEPEMVTFALLPTGGAASGMVSFMRIEPAFGQIEIAAVIYARTLQRTTAATEAIHLAMAYAFDDLGYRRFEWKCDSLNEPSRRAAPRLGFAYEGRFRNHMVTKGRNRDTDWFSVTDGEWPAVRAAHRRWLDPANFDDSGRQRVSLSELTGGLSRPASGR